VDCTSKTAENKFTKKLNIIKIISHYKWGAERKTLLVLFHSLMQSTLDYGSTIYGSGNPNILQLLNPIHNDGIRLATGAFRTSPIDSLHCESGILPLELR
jgi:hypothetical protein